MAKRSGQLGTDAGWGEAGDGTWAHLGAAISCDSRDYWFREELDPWSVSGSRDGPTLSGGSAFPEGSGALSGPTASIAMSPLVTSRLDGSPVLAAIPPITGTARP
ncbi:hypothetical protein P170DRAFT_506242 [Aspergillus steynii IBT 23096]|uniref:Uncharacterized protein n=1 Tax=Aspergillus steynii IBT 23096 TaxID=1392250 RepID=A0A2I2GS44_9EURO|nr:uncharacterized protein P170DRAFT_506242 [Aspergillus steynii IBT 23096]PLB55696.1 hypothetical protein P170DRAFT_506242 [Aspergillus steynii IBT 23096]